jgi:hypothetical protein
VEERAPSLLKEHVRLPPIVLKSTWKRSQSDVGSGKSPRSPMLNKWSFSPPFMCISLGRYFTQDEEAGRQMTQMLATLPPAQHAPFSRLQASIRSAYHASINARRAAEFKVHLSATLPGGSLTPLSRADPTGSAAQKERYEAFERFVRSWCTVGMPGTKPFFEGLWALMRLQVVPEHLGGAGGHYIHWEIDDAVLKESG